MPLPKLPQGVQVDWGHPLAKGLVGCWRFAERGGTKLYDLARHRQHATLQNSPLRTSGDRGPAVEFNGLTGYASTAQAFAFTDFTCIVRFKSSSGSAGARLADKNYATGFWLGRNALGGSNSWGGGVMETGSPYGRYVTLADGAWHQIASVRSGTTHTIYGDGGKVSTSGTVSGSACDSSAFTIAASNVISDFGGAQIDFVYLWARALTAREIAKVQEDPDAFLEGKRHFSSTVPSGPSAITGSSTWSWSNGTTTLTGAGALAGSSALSWSNGTSTLRGTGALGGTSAWSWSNGTSTLAGAGAMAGSCTWTFGQSGATSGTVSISGSAAWNFAGSATLTGAGALAGSAAWSWSPSGSLASGATLNGSASWSWSPTATLRGGAVLQGQIAWTWGATLGVTTAQVSTIIILPTWTATVDNRTWIEPLRNDTFTTLL